MAYDPYFTTNPSDSGLLDGIDAANLRPSKDKPVGNVPTRDEYTAPAPAPVDTEAVEDSLQEVPLPTGFMSRLRGFVNEL